MCITEHHYDNYYTKYSCTTFWWWYIIHEWFYTIISWSLSSLAEKQGPSYATIATNLSLYNSIVFPDKSYLILKYAQSSKYLRSPTMPLCWFLYTGQWGHVKSLKLSKCFSCACGFVLPSGSQGHMQIVHFYSTSTCKI